MRKIPPELRAKIDAGPYYKVCARLKDGSCDGRITIEHALIYAGRQINELYCLIPLCVYHHLGKGLDKRKNEWIALHRATGQEIADISKAKNWEHYRNYLDAFYV